MFIQGNLQVIFDALYNLGVIDPVLNADWSLTEKEMMKKPKKLSEVIQAANACRGDINALTYYLKQFDQESLHFLALEVAREFVDFETRKQDLH